MALSRYVMVDSPMSVRTQPLRLTTDAFETVWSTVRFSRGLFGKPRDPGKIETLLEQLRQRQLSVEQIETVRLICVQIFLGLRCEILIRRAMIPYLQL